MSKLKIHRPCLALAGCVLYLAGCVSGTKSKTDAGTTPESDAGKLMDAQTPGGDGDGNGDGDAPGDHDAHVPDGAAQDSGHGGGDGDAHDSGTPDAGHPQVDGGPPCSTRVSYGSAWIRPGGHTADYDDVAADVTWDGSCTDDGNNSYATLSNGWKPYFEGHASCVMGFDYSHCAGKPTSCVTKVTYGSAWLAPGNHPNFYDNVTGKVTWDGACTPTGSESYATLSNGWQPHFTGTTACRLGFNYQQCGGLYTNPVIPDGCADPGVMKDGDTYYVVCTSGNATDAFGLRTSKDLVNFTWQGHILPSANKPTWATGDFWAPEIHKVGNHYVAYFSARHTNGRLTIGAATSLDPAGPYTALKDPLVQDASQGVIDVSEFNDAQGKPYLVWKVDGNASGMPTPIYGQALDDDGTALIGSKTQLIVNEPDKDAYKWEGGVVEGPWVYQHDGTYYLFYSGNSYANASYAIGVARASSPLGPYEKHGAPIIKSNDYWIGPGHNSVIDGPHGTAQVFYHAWLTGKVNTPGSSRLGLVDELDWENGWPIARAAPTTRSQPMP